MSRAILGVARQAVNHQAIKGFCIRAFPIERATFDIRCDEICTRHQRDQNCRIAGLTRFDSRSQIAPRVVPRKPRRQELEFKLAELQKDYAALHTAIFEAAQVHRRLCAPRLLSYQDFEIASEIFAVRHLPGDFFTVEESNDGIILALGDICGKGLSAGMWTTHVAGLVRAHTSRPTDTEEIMTQVNVDLVRMLPLRPFASLFLANLNPTTGVLH